MTDSPHRGREEQSGFSDGPNPTQPLGNTYPGYTDPAYASQAPYGPAYQAPAAPAPTEQLPAYSPYGYDPYSTGQYASTAGSIRQEARGNRLRRRTTNRSRPAGCGCSPRPLCWR